ncbi:hypothetical protein TNCV_4771921 [Trichonephila clavipes]|nr:hypothetical protein TNCV_4771921 [Trichonephila clavipes]
MGWVKKNSHEVDCKSKSEEKGRRELGCVKWGCGRGVQPSRACYKWRRGVEWQPTRKPHNTPRWGLRIIPTHSLWFTGISKAKFRVTYNHQDASNLILRHVLQDIEVKRCLPMYRTYSGG